MQEDMYQTRDWITKEVIKMGQNPFAYFNALYRSQPTCKGYISEPNNKYDECMIEKANCCYEETKRLFNKLDKDKKASELEQKLLS